MSQQNTAPQQVVRPEDLDKVANESDIGPINRVPDLPVRRTGLFLFVLVGGITVAVLVVLALYGWWTYPSVTDVAALLEGREEANRLEAWQQEQANWMQRLRDLAQTFLLTPFVPLLTAIAGYIFGVREASVPGP